MKRSNFGKSAPEPPLVFIYIGNQVPNYARYSLAIARRNFSGDIYLILDDSDFTVPKGVQTIYRSDWYASSQFDRFVADSALDPLLGNGFWYHTAERLFVLAQFMRSFDLARAFHAELDVYVSDLEGLASKLDHEGLGIFVPADSPGRALASLLYSNNPAALDRLAVFALENASLGNEMQILAAFLRARPEDGHALPSDHSLGNTSWPYFESTVGEKVGLIDAVGFGKWLFGLDPKFRQESTRNKADNEIPHPNLEGFRFSASPRGRRILVTDLSGQDHQIRAVHVHSKIHRILRFPFALTFFCWAIQLPWRTVVVYKRGSMAGKLLGLLLSEKMHKTLIFFPSNLRFVLGKLILLLSDTSPRLLSNRQRANALKFFRPCQTLPEASRGKLSIIPDQTREHPEIDGFLDERACGKAIREEASLMLFLYHLEPSLVLVERVRGDGGFCFRRLRELGTLPIYLSPTKDYANTRHTVFFWNNGVKAQWSFDPKKQVVNTSWIREMFPLGREQIYDWVKSGVERRDAGLSTLGAYGIWAVSKKPKKVKICPPSA